MITAIIVVRETISIGRAPVTYPSIARIRENSDTCASPVPTMKAVLASYPNIVTIVVVITGFKTSTINEKTNIGPTSTAISASTSCMPSETKNIVAKKSLRDETRAIISRL